MWSKILMAYEYLDKRHELILEANRRGLELRTIDEQEFFYNPDTRNYEGKTREELLQHRKRFVEETISLNHKELEIFVNLAGLLYMLRCPIKSIKLTNLIIER